jgi:hypothetical protein
VWNSVPENTATDRTEGKLTVPEAFLVHQTIGVSLQCGFDLRRAEDAVGREDLE